MAFLKKQPSLIAAFLAILSVNAWSVDQAIGPFGGLNNTDNAATIPADKAQDLLNVDLSLGGRSVLKREGFGLAYALSITTSPVHGVYNFFDASGNDVALAFNDTRMTSSINGGAITVLFSSGPVGATYQCTDSQGFAYCVNTTRNNVIKTNGATYSMQTVVTTGTMITVTPDRLVQSGFSAAPNRVDFSAAADFTSWTTGVAATSAFQFTVSAPGSRITHITYAFNRVMWFKDASFGFIMPGQTAADWVVQTVSPNVGTLDNTSVYYQGILYFRGNDAHIWSYDGSNLVKLTRDIGGTINASQSRASNSWTQTTQADFQAGATSPGGWVSTESVSGILYLATTTPVSPFVDTNSSDFNSAFSLTNVDTTTVSGSVKLTLDLTLAASLKEDEQNSGLINLSACTPDPYIAQQWQPSSDYILASITLRLKKVGTPDNYSLSIWNDNSNTIGTFITSTTITTASLSTSYAEYNYVFSSSKTLLGTSKYWMSIGKVTAQTCVGTDYVDWAGANGSTGFYDNGSYSNNHTAWRQVYGKGFSASGNLVSRAFDVGFTTNTWLWNWSTFSTSQSTPTNTTLTYETQTSSSATGIFNTLVSVSSGSSPTSSIQQFIRYKASFATSNTSTSPILNLVSLANGDRRRPSGSFYSAVKNAPNITTWDTFTVTKQDNDGTHTFYTRASTNPIPVTSSTPSWTAISAGAVPSISTGTYFQVRDDFLILMATQNPTLFDFTQSWFEGSASDKAYATFFDDAIWWSIASGAGATSNNTILKFDLTNTAWLKYDIPINGFYTRQNRLYFGSALTGNVFKYGDSDSDNGDAIEAYWKSKDFFMSSPFTDDDVTNLSFFFKAVENSSMTATFIVNGSSETEYTIPLSRLNASYGRYNRNLPLGTVGNTFSVKFGNESADQPFEVFAIGYSITPKSWKPGE